MEVLPLTHKICKSTPQGQLTPKQREVEGQTFANAIYICRDDQSQAEISEAEAMGDEESRLFAIDPFEGTALESEDPGPESLAMHTIMSQFELMIGFKAHTMCYKSTTTNV